MPLLYRQVRIFVLPDLPPDVWVETVVGRVIRPAIGQLAPEWFWFSRYAEGRAGSNVDCDIEQIPPEFNGVGPDGFFRSVRFRVHLMRPSSNPSNRRFYISLSRLVSPLQGSWTTPMSTT